LFAIGLRRAAASWPVWLAVAAALGLVAIAFSGQPGSTSGMGFRPVAAAAGSVLNVRTDCGAAGNGSTNDTPAINRCIARANAAGGATVEFPSGTYVSANSIHMMSNVTLQLDAGSTIMGAGGTGYDAPEPNPNSAFQDFGHSHFHDAMLWGDRLTNIGFVGSGAIDGGGHLIRGNPGTGQADKIISLTRCDGLTLSGITLRRGGHFAALINGCNHVTSDSLTIATSGDRDGWNIISTQNVNITNIHDAANDDALVFKSDWALGATLPNGNVTVTNAVLSASCCNALMFGSETCGDFTNYDFEHITITGAGKSGLGMVSSDGAHISHVIYNDIQMSGHINSLIMQKVWDRLRCGTHPAPGSITDVHYSNIHASTTSTAFSPTLWGLDNSTHNVSNVTFDNVDLTVPGGGSGNPDTLPSNAHDYNPNSIGPRPAFGMFMHDVSGVTFTNSGFHANAGDARPALDDITGTNITVDTVTASRSTGAQDVHFNGTAGYCVKNSPALRVTAVGSTQHCQNPVNDFGLAVAPATQSVTAGATATYTVHASVVSGTPDAITLTGGGAPAGAAISFSPNPVAPGSDSTMTVTTSGTTPAGTSSLTVTGTDSFGTHSAGTSLTVTAPGGNDFGLSVAPASQSVAAGATATYTVHTSVVSGTPDAVTLSGSGAPAGATISFSPNPVAPGSDSTMTVATSTTTPAGTSSLTVTGADSFATHSATTSLTVTTGGGLTISGLTVADPANASHWSLQTNLAVGNAQYGDRTYTLTAIPTALRGAQWIRTANSSKAAAGNPLVTFTISQQAVVSVAVDTRLGRRSWMDSSWVDTHVHLTNSESSPKTFEVFQKTFPAGQVALGPNSGSTSSMYTVIVT
jgi:polygalacturonase